ncbi:MAG TPA: ABC transporter ATP-binding protein [Acidimicrobiales bacterium]|jgi:ABC-2 type transport system ATP-binding protein|nr:ABC transporter ATP-binding protein [Acidimicrobiales bacterium]
MVQTVETVLSCRGLRKSYSERVAVDGVGFDIARGETYGLLGPNGAGKTTTISMVCGLLSRDAGEVTVAGRPMGPEATDAKAAIGLVPQDVALYDNLTAHENLRFFGRLQGLQGSLLDQRVAEVLDIVGLADRGDDRIDTYSGGMKRRANIAAGLLHRPQLLVLDEPTVGVDPQSRNAILESVEALGAEGLSVLYTTHYMEEAERLCDRVGIIDEGRLVAEGTRRELVSEVGAGDRVDVSGTGDLDALAAACAELPGTVGVDRRDGGLAVRVTAGPAALAGIVDAAGRVGVTIGGLELVEPDLEDVFLELTGKALRD